MLPLLATQILWVNLVTDSTPALAMGVDPEIDYVMPVGLDGCTHPPSTVTCGPAPFRSAW